VSRPAPHPVPALHRLAYAEGARLAERDLRDLVAYERRLLELHVRALHDTWGVALGLRLALSNDRRRVLVSPGVAYTCRGEALALPSGTTTEPPADTSPPQPGPASRAVDLVLGAAPTPEGGPCERVATCTGEHAALAPGAVRWVYARLRPSAPAVLGEDVRLGEEVPLGRFARAADGTLTGPDLSVRRAARGLVRPHVAFGITRPGEVTLTASAYDVWGHVDTTAGAFGGTPHYFASVSPLPPAAIGPFVSVTGATPRRFTIRLALATDPPIPASGLLPEVAAMLDGLTVRWVGVESTTGCPPAAASLTTLLGDTRQWSAALAALGLLGGNT
jgi:hypothetical protein